MKQIPLLEIRSELYKKSFYEFVKAAWKEVDPAPFVDSKYIEVICSHLEWVYSTGNNLVINIPPRHAKSLLVSVMFNAWVWANDPTKSFLCTTHSLTLTLRDSQKARQLIKSKWFTDHFGDIGFSSDQDVKSRFVNESKGSRQSVSVDAKVTGDGADIRIGDDPLDASDSLNDNAIDKVNDYFDQTFSTRIKDPNYCPTIIVMQRLAPSDLSGHLIEKGWNVLCLPLEYDPFHPIQSTTPAEAWPKGMDSDWRTDKGELLCPERYGNEFVNTQKLSQGIAYNGQYNQYPSVAEGDIIKNDQFGEYTNLDITNFSELIIRVDTAEKTGKNNAYTVFGLFAKKYNSTDLYVLDIHRGKWEIEDLMNEAIGFWNKHFNKRYNENPSFSSFGIEDKSSGTQLLQMLQRRGLGVEAITRNTSKDPNVISQERKKWQRLDQVGNQLKLTNSRILIPSERTSYTDAEWTQEYKTELTTKQRERDELGFWDQADVTSDAGFDLLINGQRIDASQLGYY